MYYQLFQKARNLSEQVKTNALNPFTVNPFPSGLSLQGEGRMNPFNRLAQTIRFTPLTYFNRSIRLV